MGIKSNPTIIHWPASGLVFGDFVSMPPRIGLQVLGFVIAADQRNSRSCNQFFLAACVCFVGDYLRPNGLTHGIYLVGWFVCDKWSNPQNKLTSQIFTDAQQEVVQLAAAYDGNLIAKLTCYIKHFSFSNLSNVKRCGLWRRVNNSPSGSVRKPCWSSPIWIGSPPKRHQKRFHGITGFCSTADILGHLASRSDYMRVSYGILCIWLIWFEWIYFMAKSTFLFKRWGNRSTQTNLIMFLLCMVLSVLAEFILHFIHRSEQI